MAITHCSKAKLNSLLDFIMRTNRVFRLGRVAIIEERFTQLPLTVRKEEERPSPKKHTHTKACKKP